MNSAFYLKTIYRISYLAFCLMGILNMPSSGLCTDAEKLYGKEYTVGPEDMLSIQVWDNETLNRTVEISQEGSFTFPLIGKVQAEGLSIIELEKLIKIRLADGYIINPQVTVNMEKYQNQKVLIYGEVERPGSYFLKRKIHVLELVSLAGGFTDNAGQNIKIVRPKDSMRIRKVDSPGDDKDSIIISLNLSEFQTNIASETFYVTSGDSVYIEKLPQYYVTGSVINPGSFSWKKGLTIHQAIYLAGGPNETAALKRTKIVRVNNGKEEEYKVNMDDLLMPEDIIKVPGSYF